MDDFWSYFFFALIVVALCVIWWLLNRMDKRTKNRYKKNAYRLLDQSDCSKQEITQTIKMLRLYGGRFRKDKEFVQLVNRLIDKLDQIEGVKTLQS
jgi:hypothetical protein